MTDKPRKPHHPTDKTHPLYDETKDPLSDLYQEDEADTKGRHDSPADDGYKIGPGFPPREHTWRKGCPSPNPKGRRRKEPSMRPDLKKALESALNTKVVVTRDKREVVLTKATLGIEQLVNQFAKGDRHARRDVFQYASVLGVELHAKETIEEALGVNEQAIVDAALRRRLQQAAPERSPVDHVKAPSDLLDDDVVKSASGTGPESAPEAAAKQPGEPASTKKQRPMSEAERRYAESQQRHFLAEQKKKQGGS